jgi:hypothetical protein
MNDHLRAAVAALALIASSPAPATDILGTKPAYLEQAASGFANERAIVKKLWMPGLDDGYVPQGLAIDGRHILVSAYQEPEIKGGRASCRIFRIEAETGKDAGSFAMPPECAHSGGIAALGGGMIVVADTGYLWRIDLEKALATGKADDAMRGMVRLGGELRGSFMSFDGTDLWIGTYTVRKDAAKAKLHRLKLTVFDEHNGATIEEKHAVETMPSPPLGQGMAFQGKDTIWIAASSSQIGWLHRLERAGGKVSATYDTIIGIEGIAFDREGRLWAVSEAGAKKYLKWRLHFPVIFAIDPSKLE